MTKFVTKQVGKIFKFNSSNAIYHSVNVKISDSQKQDYYPYVVRSSQNNGIRGYIKESTSGLNPANTISLAQDTAQFFYQDQPYFTGNKVKVLTPINFTMNKEVALYLISVMNKAFSSFGWGSNYSVDNLKPIEIQVPVKSNNKLDTEYMADYVKKIEADYVKKIETYLAVLGYKSLADCQLNQHDLNMLSAKPIMKGFKAIKMFDQPIRGKRIKSDDRITGTLPFITAGVDKQGISAYIGNNTHIFPKNSITIDMFGNVFYRYFQYGADDHVTVLTSNKYNKKQMLYLTSCLSKSLSYNQYTYSKNFYPKDVIAITLSLPVTSSDTPDWQFMEDYITAIEKLKVLKIKQFLDTKINAYQNIIK